MWNRYTAPIYPKCPQDILYYNNYAWSIIGLKRYMRSLGLPTCSPSIYEQHEHYNVECKYGWQVPRCWEVYAEYMRRSDEEDDK